MKRKKGGGGGGANWMDTYGDMVTLLLCFFVLLYSMSTISEENWKNLVMSFNPEADLSIHEAEGGDGPSADGDEAGVAMTQDDIDDAMDKLYQSLQNFVAAGGIGDQVSFFRESGKIFISFSDTIFFDGDSPVLREESKTVLDAVGGMLRENWDYIDEVHVLGHTAQSDPNRPNRVKSDRTLASQRATNVVIYLQEMEALDPGRLISVGIGQWKPVATNDTPEGRAQNRRVEMIISGMDLEEKLQGKVADFDIR